MRASVLSLLLLGAGCSFLGEKPFGERVPADVAPWQDIGPLVICDAAARLGVPALGTAGLCLPATSDTPACDADSQCGTREACVCGRCRVATCDSAEECTGGRVCTFSDRVCDRSCGSDDDCLSGEKCVAGRNICRGTCGADADCQHGERCDTGSGLCSAAACSGDGDCGGFACELQRTPSAIDEASPLADGTSLALYFQRTDPGGAPVIWRATGTDGTHFSCDPDTPLLTGEAPSVVIAGASDVRMLFSRSGDTYGATSRDGVHFTENTSVLIPGVDQPSLLIDASGDQVAYARKDGQVVRAESSDGVSWSEPAAVLTPAQVTLPILWQGVTTLRSPYASLVRGVDGHEYTRLWFSAFGQESAPSTQFGVSTPTPPNYSIGVAASADGVTFTPYPYDPVFDRVSDFLDHLSEMAPAVIATGGRQLLYFTRGPAMPSSSPSDAQNIGVATNPVTP